MDNFTCRIDGLDLSTTTVLQMNILDTIDPPPRPLTKKIARTFKSAAKHRILVSDMFSLVTPLACLQRKSQQDVSRLPFIIRQLHQLLDSGQLRYQDFMYHVCIPAEMLSASSRPISLPHDAHFELQWCRLGSLTLAEATSKSVRKHIIANLAPPAFAGHPSSPDPNVWPHFWSYPLATAVRNLWFRALHQKLSCRALLHRINPRHFTSDLCPICVEGTGDLDHFLFNCPKKWKIWKRAWSDLLLLPIEPQQVRDAIRLLKLPRSPPNVRSITILESILHGIRKAHWAKVFDDEPFIICQVLNSIHQTVRRRLAENNVNKLSL